MYPEFRQILRLRNWPLTQVCRIAVGCLLVLFASAAAGGITLKVDRVTLNSPVIFGGNLTRVNFHRSYATPPAVFVLPTDSNPEPSHLRVLNVTTSGFDVQQFEPSGEDGLTPFDQISYLAITPGTHSLPTGELIEVGFINITNHQGNNVPGASYANLTFSNSFPTDAALLVEIQSNNNGTLTPGIVAAPALTVVTRDVDNNGADIALEYSETSAGVISNSEQIAYLAIASGTDTSFMDDSGTSRTIEAIRSADNITGWDDACQTVNFSNSFSDPLVFANKSTRDGGDGGWLRRCSLNGNSAGFSVDEDQAQDADRSHTTEEASVVVIDGSFDSSFASGGWEADTVNLPAVNSNNASLSFTNVTFPSPMSGTPVVLTQPGTGDNQPVAIRLQNVSSSGFQIAAFAPPGSIGAVESMVLDYIAVVPGSYALADGTEFEAGFVDSVQVQRAANVGGPEGFTTVNFNQTYSQTPTFLAHLQTINNATSPANPAMVLAPWLTVAVDGLTATNAQVALERSEVDDGAVNVAERIGYMVFPANLHGNLLDRLGNTLAYDSRLVVDAVVGFDDGCTAVTYTMPFTSVPLAVGHGATRAGNNGGWARRCGNSTSALSQTIDEDQASDSERAHINEDISQLAFSQAFEWPAEPNITISITNDVIQDGFNTTNFKALPGAELDANVLVTNDGPVSADSDSLAMVFAVDPNTELFVGDLDGGGHSLAFVDGIAPNQSGLVWIPADHISYSSDNATTFNYVPPSTFDFDPSVTHFRITPAGSLLGVPGAPIPQFTLRYRVRVR